MYGKNPKPVWNEEDDLVFGSTTRPRWSYGASKAIDEFLTLACSRQFGLPVVIGRFFNVVGPRQTGAYGMVLPRFVDAALAGRPLIVHDDGAGLPAGVESSRLSHGIVGMRQRVRALNGTFKISSRSGTGTTVEVYIPLPPPAAAVNDSAPATGEAREAPATASAAVQTNDTPVTPAPAR